jgi:hypothetical protein
MNATKNKDTASIKKAGGSHHSAIIKATGTLIKLLVMNNSGVNKRNVLVTVAVEEHVALQRGHLIKATAVGAFS